MAKTILPNDRFHHCNDLRFPYCDGKLIDLLIEIVNRVIAKHVGVANIGILLKITVVVLFLCGVGHTQTMTVTSCSGSECHYTTPEGHIIQCTPYGCTDTALKSIASKKNCKALRAQLDDPTLDAATKATLKDAYSAEIAACEKKGR